MKMYLLKVIFLKLQEKAGFQAYLDGTHHDKLKNSITIL